MTTNKSIEKYLWLSAVLFITYLFIGSFLVSKNYFDLFYIVMLYSFMLVVKIIDRKK